MMDVLETHSLTPFHLFIFFSVSVHQTVQTATATASELRLAVELVWTAGTRRQSAEREQPGRGTPGGWVWRSEGTLGGTAVSWNWRTGNSARALDDRRLGGRGLSGIPQWECRVGIRCQPDENVDPSSLTPTAQADACIQSPLPTRMMCLTAFVPS